MVLKIKYLLYIALTILMVPVSMYLVEAIHLFILKTLYFYC